MHTFIVNASIQIIPITLDKHPYLWVDEAIYIIKQSGLKNETGPFATVIEGEYTKVMALINNINEHLLEKGCSEWISNIQIQIRSQGDMLGEEKTAKFR